LSLLRGTLVLTSSTTPMSMAHKCTNARMGGALRQRATPFSSGPCGSHHSNQGRNRGRGPVLRLLVRAHRVESDEVARAFGVSNHTPRQIDLLKTAVSQPIAANQLQLSITHALIVAHGVAANMHGLDQSVTLDGGGILDRLAAHYGVPPIAIATAWITRHPAQMQVVLGTTTPQRVGRTFSGPANLLVRVSVTTLTRTRSIETGRGFYERQQRRFNSKQRPGYEVTGFMSREI